MGAGESCSGVLQTLQLFAPPFCPLTEGSQGKRFRYLHRRHIARDIELLMKVDPRYYHTSEVQGLKSRQRFAPPAPAIGRGKWGQQQLELFWAGSLERVVGKRELRTGNMCSVSGNKKKQSESKDERK